MMKLKKRLWKAYKDTTRKLRILTGAPRAKGMVALSLQDAQSVYGGRTDVTVHPFVRKCGTVLNPPKHLPEDLNFHDNLFLFPQAIPDYEAVLLDIRNPAFTFQHHHLLDDRRRVIYEPHLKFENLPIKDRFLVECEKLNGTVAYLGNTLFCQYGHWIQAQLPLLTAYWETFGKDNIDYYYIGDGQIKDFAEESLLQLGIRKEQIISFPCRADRSLIAIKTRHIPTGSLVGAGLQMDGHSFRFLKEKLFHPRKIPDGSVAQKVFVMRGEVSGRRELNLPEVRAVLEPRGFRFVGTQGKTMQEEADLFGNAEVVIAVHGAALHNLIFARPGTKVVEIAPYDYFEESNYLIANHNSCDYWYMIGEPVSGVDSGASLMERNRADVRISTDKLIRLCETAGIF